MKSRPRTDGSHRRCVALLLTVASVLSACTRESSPPDIIVILIDTLRADRVGAHGSSRPITPFIDSLADRAYVFHSAYAPAPWTHPSVASLFTARLPSQHAIVAFDSVLASGETTLAEVLKARGYATGAFLAHLLLHGRGLEQGFDEFRVVKTAGRPDLQSGRKPRAPAVNELVHAWLEQRAKSPRSPLFVYLHYMEPHPPYGPPAETFRRLTGRELPDLGTVNGLALMGTYAELSPDLLREVTDAYDAEVLSLDESLRRLFAALEPLGVLRNAIVVITADHGEGFQDHGYIGHGKSLYNELIRVPLIIRVPGLATRVDVWEPVSLIDLAPALLDWAGIAVPEAFEGRSLKSVALRSQPGSVSQPGRPADGARPVISERAAVMTGNDLNPTHQRALILGNKKYIGAATNDGELDGELYDLGADPGEKRPLSVGALEGERLRRALDQAASRGARGAATPQSRPLDAQTREIMRALGYGEQ